ncbi:MAG: twin-arginine translocation signal domain-containing protein [Candidatus Hydrogenedentales bacterium]
MTCSTRRSFLKHSVAGAVSAAAAPMILPSGVLARAGARAPMTASSSVELASA